MRTPSYSSSLARRGTGMLLLAVIVLAFAIVVANPVPARAAGVSNDRPPVRTAAPTLRLGSRGPAVRALQSRLARLTYLPSEAVDGVFGMRTWHAVVAFQGWHALGRDGIIGPLTRAALKTARRPRPWSNSSGFEVHIAQQVLLLIRGGQVRRVIHVSTGAGGMTPGGHFTIIRREAMSWSVRFHVWMPLAQYFYGGYAMHEFTSVPAYPASHGCIRVPSQESRVVWQFGRIGMRLWTRN